jgi:hypothetical protein
MRKTLLTVVAAASITLAVLDVVAAPTKAVLKGFYYAGPLAAIHVAVPAGTKRFSTDLLPQ